MEIVYFVNPDHPLWRHYMSLRESAMNRLADGPCTTGTPTPIGYAGTAAGQYDPSAKDCCARERTARELLTAHYQTESLALDDLAELLKALPQELPYRADRALRRLIQK